MKVCLECGRIVSDGTERCPECKTEDFEDLLVPFYNDITPYLEERDEHIQDAME